MTMVDRIKKGRISIFIWQMDIQPSVDELFRDRKMAVDAGFMQKTPVVVCISHEQIGSALDESFYDPVKTIPDRQLDRSDPCIIFSISIDSMTQ